MLRLHSLFRNLFRRTEMEQDLEAELRSYIDLLTTENEQRGMSLADARRSALIALGGLTQVREQTRDAKAGIIFEAIVQDLRYTLRMFRKSPGFFCVASVTLALGIGLTTALFSLVDAVLLRSLPYPDANRLISLAEVNDEGYPSHVSYPDLKDWREQNHSVQYIAGYGSDDISISGGSSAIRTHAALVTQDFFQALETLPALGRDLSIAEHQPGAAASVIISDSLWRSMFGSRPDILGQSLKLLGGLSFRIIGVMPPGFDFPEHSTLWVAGELFNGGLDSRTAHNFLSVGKLKPGTPVSVAQQDIGAISRRIKSQFPGAYQAKDARVISLRDEIVGSVKLPLFTLFAAVGFLLLIVCVNVANLLLARASARVHELSIRSALGAARARLFRQLVIESLALSTAGGLIGVALAWSGLRVLKLFVPDNIPRIDTVGLDLHGLLFAGLTSVLVGLLFGIVPAFTATRTDANERLKQAATRHTATRKNRQIGNMLVTSEIALAFVLLVGMGLLARSFEQLRSQPAGFEPANVLTAELSFPVTSLNGDAPDRLEHYKDIAAQIRTMPGVQAVAYTRALPLTRKTPDGHFSIEGQADLPGLLSDANYGVASPDYFRAIGARLLAGRYFSEDDGPSSMPVVVINSALAKAVFPRGDALNHRLWFDSFDPERSFMRIVGIVDDIRENGLNQAARAAAYVCYSQHPHQLTDTNLVVKVSSNPINLAPSIRRIIQSVDKDVAVSFDTLGDLYGRSISHERFEAQMLGLFAIIAVLLAGIGIYGVLSYFVQQTRSEIGIRLALGAEASNILAAVLLRGVRSALLGALIGLPIILAISRMLSSALYEVSSFDPITYSGAAFFLLAIVLLASYLPARRAMRIEPVVALRYE